MIRLDQLLVRRGLAPSRQRAKELIAEGQVLVNGVKAVKPSYQAPADAVLEILGEPLPYPSRAGLKLERALEVFAVEVTGRTALDVGASTGGFTSCLLRAGARKVYGVDVGQDQLVPELRSDPRVVVMEKTNIRDLTPEQLPELADLATIDVSFISLTKVFPHVRALLKPGADVIALIKPQFETGGVGLSKHGVIQDPRIHLTYLPPLVNELQGQDLGLLGFEPSPISGLKGNLEFLAHFRLGAAVRDASHVVAEAIRAGWDRQSGKG
ncbi:MAG: TlyA family RNA methyltransferase [Limnochordia bacterium]|nr:TlyA family RNA methyltransferase [Limnochordia bacterium]MDI9465289.1 TlyA family RNA methyltransferase [Bacillota bacterium]HOB40027.1 TlyA family RNA methyltransferase [Limnochordia bacterium]HOK31146.1 TlyA family RNA methyltransferase [Limnochordia bacterium]HOM00475.1 TlyA family RNA methyltransferase [Limnochordia bacterium]